MIWSFANVVPASDYLAKQGMASLEIGSRGQRRCSTLEAKPALIQAISEAGLSVLNKPGPLVVVRDDDGASLPLKDTEEIRRLWRQVEVVNEAALGQALTIEGVPVKGGYQVTEAGLHCPADLTIRRIFNVSTRHNGRGYGTGSFQQLPGKIRDRLLIDGQSTVELDFSAIHPTLALASHQIAYWGDFYTIGGTPRELVKQATVVLLNAKNEASAKRSIAQKIDSTRRPNRQAFEAAAELIEAIRSARPEIVPFICTGAGLELMRRDSDVTLNILLQAARDSVRIHNVFDSYIVPDTKETWLFEAMARAQAESYKRGIRTTVLYPPKPSAGFIMPNGTDRQQAATVFQPTLFFQLEAGPLDAYDGDPLNIEQRHWFSEAQKRHGLTDAETATRLSTTRRHLKCWKSGRAKMVPDHVRSLIFQMRTRDHALSGAL